MRKAAFGVAAVTGILVLAGCATPTAPAAQPTEAATETASPTPNPIPTATGGPVPMFPVELDADRVPEAWDIPLPSGAPFDETRVRIDADGQLAAVVLVSESGTADDLETWAQDVADQWAGEVWSDSRGGETVVAVDDPGTTDGNAERRADGRTSDAGVEYSSYLPAAFDQLTDGSPTDMWTSPLPADDAFAPSDLWRTYSTTDPTSTTIEGSTEDAQALGEWIRSLDGWTLESDDSDDETVQVTVADDEGATLELLAPSSPDYPTQLTYTPAE